MFYKTDEFMKDIVSRGWTGETTLCVMDKITTNSNFYTVAVGKYFQVKIGFSCEFFMIIKDVLLQINNVSIVSFNQWSNYLTFTPVNGHGQRWLINSGMISIPEDKLDIGVK